MNGNSEIIIIGQTATSENITNNAAQTSRAFDNLNAMAEQRRIIFGPRDQVTTSTSTSTPLEELEIEDTQTIENAEVTTTTITENLQNIITRNRDLVESTERAAEQVQAINENIATLNTTHDIADAQTAHHIERMTTNINRLNHLLHHPFAAAGEAFNAHPFLVGGGLVIGLVATGYTLLRWNRPPGISMTISREIATVLSDPIHVPIPTSTPGGLIWTPKPVKPDYLLVGASIAAAIRWLLK